MFRLTSAHPVVVLSLAAAIILPARATAQTRTLTTGQAQISATVVDPCTNDSVSVTGYTALNVLEVIDANGALSFSMTSVTTAAGGSLTASTTTNYSFSESAEVSQTGPSPSALPLTYFTNLDAKGSTASDRWILKLNTNVSIDQYGNIVSASSSPVDTVCIGVIATAVPNVVGLTQAAATASLTGAGFTVSVTFAPSTTVAGGLVISQTPTGGSNATRGSNVALVISQGTAPTIATFVTPNTTTPNTIITSPAFAVAANTLVVAFVATDGPATTPATPAGSRQVVNNMTNSGAALTWMRAAQANAQAGDSEIWWAFVPTARASLTVNSVFRFSAVAHMTVVGFTGAQNTLVGAASAITNKGTGVAGDPSISIATTRPNSWLFGVGNDWDHRETLTANAGTTIVGQGSTAITDTFFTVRSSNAVPTAGSSAAVGVSGLGTDRYNFAVIEIRQP